VSISVSVDALQIATYPPVKVMEKKSHDRHGEPARSLLKRVAATALGRVVGDFIVKLIASLDL
jgi:hypothetical protein